MPIISGRVSDEGESGVEVDGGAVMVIMMEYSLVRRFGVGHWR